MPRIERAIILIANYSRLYVIRVVFSCELRQWLNSKTMKTNNKQIKKKRQKTTGKVAILKMLFPMLHKQDMIQNDNS